MPIPSRPSEFPAKVRPFLDLGFDPVDQTGDEFFGTGPFNTKSKFYVNQLTGQWKDHVSGKSGNLATFLAEWCAHCRKETPLTVPLLAALADKRGLPAHQFVECGMFWDGDRYVFPVYNARGTVVNLRRFRMGGKRIGLSALGVQLWGLERVKPTTETVYVAEGEYDTLAARQLLAESDLRDEILSNKIAVIGTPGSSTWKETWNEHVEGKDLVVLYDNDAAGMAGTERLASLLGNRGRRLFSLKWDAAIPVGYDVNDFYKDGGDWATLREMFGEGAVTSLPATEKPTVSGNLEDRGTFEHVCELYRKWLFMNSDTEQLMKVIYGTIISNQLSGDPLWMHVVGSPGSGKTELLMSCSDSPDVVVASNVSPASLVSGYQNHGGVDPSLIPQVIGKVLIMKDFTEILQMPKIQRDEVYGILRGAYDGEVFRRYGNGVVRHYQGYFSLITGVTHAIDGENMSGLGERFLKFRIASLRDNADQQESLMLDALRNVGKEHLMKTELMSAASRFLNVVLPPEKVPDVPLDYLYKIVSLAEIVSFLRTTVERDFTRERIAYRPEPEAGTRIAKQLKRLFIGLSLVNTPFAITEEDYQTVVKCALDSCTLFNLEVARHLARNPGQTLQEISKAVRIPSTTLREVLDNLELIRVHGDEGVVTKYKDEADVRGRGAPPFKYRLSSRMKSYWEKACLQ